jgi:HD-like signal output (HDOD) protein
MRCAALSARSLAVLAGLDADACFTVGLLQHFGLLVTLYLMPDQVKQWGALAVATRDKRRDLEPDCFSQHPR